MLCEEALKLKQNKREKQQKANESVIQMHNK